MKENSFEYFSKRFLRPHLATIIFILVLNSMSMLFSFISPLLTKSLIDDVFIDKKTELFKYILLGTIGIYIVSSLSGFLSNYIRGKLDLILFRDIAEESFNTIQLGSIRKTQEIMIGDLISRIMSNTKLAASIYTHIVPEVILSTVRIIIPFVIMLFLDLRLSLVIMTPTLLFFLSSSFFGKKLERTQRASLVNNASIFSFLKENFSMMPVIKVFGLETWSKSKFSEQMKKYYDSTIDYTKISSLSSSIGSLIYGIPMILLISLGGPMVMQGSLTLGTFTAFMSYVALFVGPITQLSYLWTAYKSSLPAFDRIYEVFQLEPDSKGDVDLIIKNGIIKFDNVWFSYNNRPILQGFNATFKKGLNYIVGGNGTGKSTILKLLCSIYFTDKGSITIDGQEISKVKRDDLRKNISMIFSEAYLFDGSIYENIQIGRLSASQAEVVRAAKLVQVHEFVTELPQGYQTKIGENGLMLSSGEKQKVALARAILKNSPIILLDEVTKSIDIASRNSINNVIKSLKNERTIIIITHNENEIEKDSNIIYAENFRPQNDGTIHNAYSNKIKHIKI